MASCRTKSYFLEIDTTTYAVTQLTGPFTFQQTPELHVVDDIVRTWFVRAQVIASFNLYSQYLYIIAGIYVNDNTKAKVFRYNGPEEEWTDLTPAGMMPNDNPGPNVFATVAKIPEDFLFTC